MEREAHVWCVCAHVCESVCVGDVGVVYGGVGDVCGGGWCVEMWVV